MQLIGEAEGERRGLYGGAVGYLGYDGNLDTAITIRSAVLRDDRIHVTVGAGIVARSVPEKEFEETEHKAGAIRRAMEMAIAEAVAGAGAAAAVGTPGASGAPGASGEPVDSTAGPQVAVGTGTTGSKPQEASR
jgi:anthranilate synthase component 1